MINHSFIIIVLAGLSCNAAVWAQGVEAEWRVINEVSSTVIPTYVPESPNPFPTVAVVQAQPQAIAEDPDLLINQQKAQVLEEARTLMGGKNFMLANTDNLYFGGYVEGAQGKRVLYQSRWLRVGDAIPVPVKSSGNIFQVVQRLKEMDADMAQKLEAEVEGKLTRGEIKLYIKEISKDKVILSDDSRTYSVSLAREGL